MNHTKGGLVIFTANSHPSSRELGKRIAEWVHDEDSNDIKDTHVWTCFSPSCLGWKEEAIETVNCNRDLLRTNTFHFAFLASQVWMCGVSIWISGSARVKWVVFTLWQTKASTKKHDRASDKTAMTQQNKIRLSDSIPCSLLSYLGNAEAGPTPFSSRHNAPDLQ